MTEQNEANYLKEILETLRRIEGRLSTPKAAISTAPKKGNYIRKIPKTHYKCVETGQIFYSVARLAKYFKEKFDISLHVTMIYKNLRGGCKQYKGFSFQETTEDPNEYSKLSPEEVRKICNNLETTRSLHVEDVTARKVFRSIKDYAISRGIKKPFKYAIIGGALEMSGGEMVHDGHKIRLISTSVYVKLAAMETES